MSITQNDWLTATYLFAFVGSLIALAGSLVVYFNRKNKKKGKR